MPATPAWPFIAAGKQTAVSDDDFALIIVEGSIAVVAEDLSLPTTGEVLSLSGLKHASHSIGTLHGRSCVAIDWPANTELPQPLVTVDLRRIGMQWDAPTFSMASRALQVVQWRKTHGFCSACGSKCAEHHTDFAMVCGQCGYTQYPRISPCIIVLVTRGEQILLARGANFPRPMYSTLAGFIEPGESVEEAVHREVWEETGIHVSGLQYIGSQSWPFPHSLMLGFHAIYKSGDIVVDPQEILHADWFDINRLPMIPPPPSIARHLIDLYISQR